MLLSRCAASALAVALLHGGLIRAEEPAEPAAPPGAEAPAETLPAAGGGLGSVELRVGYYHNDDNGDGNPFLDETETVIEPAIVVDVNVTDRLSLGATLSYDLVSSASIDRLSKFPEQSGASGDNYLGGDIRARYRMTDDVALGLHAGGSQEYDYLSISVGADVSVDLFEKNTTIRLGVEAFFDQVDIIRFDGSEDEGTDDRLTLTVSPRWYQVLTPTLHLDIGYSLTYQSGFLETAYNAVVLEDPSDPPNPNLDNLARGVEVAEELPDARIRHALTVSIRKYFTTGTGLDLRGRVYTDSWGLTSFAPEVRLYQWIVDQRLMVRARYRFYVQTAVDAYEDRFLVAPAERAAFIASEDRTQDSDLADFRSHTLGLKLVLHIGAGHSIDIGGDYVMRSDGIDQVLLGAGWRWEF